MTDLTRYDRDKSTAIWYPLWLVGLLHVQWLWWLTPSSSLMIIASCDVSTTAHWSSVVVAAPSTVIGVEGKGEGEGRKEREEQREVLCSGRRGEKRWLLMMQKRHKWVDGAVEPLLQHINTIEIMESLTPTSLVNQHNWYPPYALHFLAIIWARAWSFPPAGWATASTNSFHDGSPRAVVFFNQFVRTSTRQSSTSCVVTTNSAE